MRSGKQGAAPPDRYMPLGLQFVGAFSRRYACRVAVRGPLDHWGACRSSANPFSNEGLGRASS